MIYNMNELENFVSGVMDKKRFIHSIGVKDISWSLAIVHDCDMNKAVIAGIMHDYAKSLPDNIQIRECETYNLPISEYERKSPYLLHGKLGAYYSKVKFGITDEDILNAITYHTTGRPNMSTLEKIVFIADYIEPNRSSVHIPTLNHIRKLSFKDLDKAVASILSNVIRYLTDSKTLIDKTTLDAWDYYKGFIE